MTIVGKLVSRAVSGERLSEVELHDIGALPVNDLMAIAEPLTIEGFGRTVSYSRKVFIPLTHLCRDVCHYCTFAKAPSKQHPAYLSPVDVLQIAHDGVSANCREALFTLGDKPELRYAAARNALASLGHRSTIDYLESVADLVFRESGLLPHLNPGVLDREELVRLRAVSVSLGIMLESSSPRLSERGGPHFGSPDKHPARRLETLNIAGQLGIPCTSGVLIGIGETRAERIQSLVALREMHERHGHLQEIIIQNFRAKPGTKMSASPEPDLAELQWTIALARLTFGPTMSIQAPPNLQKGALGSLISAGINDWGGVSPVTPDYVNPEAPWPHLVTLDDETRDAGRTLVERLAIVPRYAREVSRWCDPKFVPAVLHDVDAEGYRREHRWHAGAGDEPPVAMQRRRREGDSDVSRIVAQVHAGNPLNEKQIVGLFAVRGAAFDEVVAAADDLRRQTTGETVTYVVNRNINYTNMCTYRCGFCAFAKGRGAKALRGPAYRLDLEEIVQRAVEATQAGATEVCLQGGIHPKFSGETYLEIAGAIKAALPAVHIHAFSPLEVLHGASTLGLTLIEFLSRLKAAGLSTLPGTAAEILDDEVRAIICPDKLNTEQWLDVMRAAHAVGLRSTATIMFGHVDATVHWARHLLRIRELQTGSGGFTEFVPLPFVHMEAPIWRRGQARSGPTWRESVLMHAVARLVLHPVIPNIQASWVKLGPEGAAMCLNAGANDMGGTLMNESITRAAGGVNGQILDAGELRRLVQSIGRPTAQRNTLYEHLPTIAGLSRQSDQESLPHTHLLNAMGTSSHSHELGRYPDLQPNLHEGRRVE